MFFGNWIEEERGLVGDERAGAFVWLARQLGFACELQSSSCSRPWASGALDVQRRGEGADEFSLKVNEVESHLSVVARIRGRRVLADAGFPLPVLLPLDAAAREFPTGFGTLTLKSAAGSDAIRVTCDARGEETELLRLGPARPPSRLPLEEISRTPPDAVPPHQEGGRAEAFALRVLDDRVLFWRGGRMTILDAWSRLEYPLPSSARAAIGKLFALELEGITLPEEPLANVQKPALLSVFHLSPVAPLEARERAGRDALPLLLVKSREARVAEAPGGSLITIRAILADVPPEGPGEAVRKTLVFHLVSEIFELGRG